MYMSREAVDESFQDKMERSSKTWCNKRFPTGVPGEYFAVGQGGWVFFRPANGDLDVRLFVESEGTDATDRLVVKTLWIEALDEDGRSAAISATRLKDFALGRIETIFNMPGYSHFVWVSGLMVTGANYDPRVCGPGEAERIASKFPLDDFKHRPLHIPDPRTRKKPDDFYRDVATAYAWAAQVARNPAQALADENHVNTTTVHRWLKEARRRKLAPPARRGSGAPAE